MQTLEQLTSPEHSAWITISQWIDNARNHCEVIKKINPVRSVSFYYANANILANGHSNL